MDVVTTKAIEHLLLPPGGPILLGFIGLLFWRLGWGRKLFVLALLLQWILSLPVTASLLTAGLEHYPALTDKAITNSGAEAIVVLGGGRYLDAPEYGGDTANQRVLFRLRYAARLAHKTGLPVIPSGGNAVYSGTAEARISAEILRDEFGVTVEHIEPRSHTTWENARFTAQLLKKLGIKRILLVTTASHMPRSMDAFARNGIDAVAAPTGFVYKPGGKTSWLNGLPNGRAVRQTEMAMHEYVGMIWYRFK
ncbi:MAG: YdcF family protein [gamma proteobacterium endosymbiont of Lamellibrachia anaximandri]|nr:YdcF family protein [gamma proteobacterium endosymbiont of Lamellibrachia anaximandri]MBL3532670.1 YdcF family protein [gamma proteobacterium endosymbiont of Lamellibrachia anaximandri]MBL3599006.1 YdcF family protein [gamma proteobacterium endosymbiont of Lamellibrachia anaximandri]